MFIIWRSCEPTGQRGAFSANWRVAAPSVCFGPWAGLASCWPLPQQLLPVSAPGGGRRCCRPFHRPPYCLTATGSHPSGRSSEKLPAHSPVGCIFPAGQWGVSPANDPRVEPCFRKEVGRVLGAATRQFAEKAPRWPVGSQLRQIMNIFRNFCKRIDN